MKGAKILLIEDDKWLAESFARSLKRQFAEVEILSNLDLAFDYFSKFWPAVIVADVLVGKKNLFTLLNEMQSYEDSRKIPIVVLSSLAQQISPEDVHAFGVVSVLDKTKITPGELRDEVKKILDEAHSLKGGDGYAK